MRDISNNTNWDIMADPAIIKEIGKNLKQIRLNKNISQEHLAKISGLDRTTISRLESGRAATLLTLVQILRALDRLDILNEFLQEPQISPIKLLKLQEKQRKRAYSVKLNNSKITK